MLQVLHVKKHFPRSGQVLQDVSFTLQDGEFLSVIGPSGAGKTTLFRILNGTEICDSGQILYNGMRFEAAKGRDKRTVQRSIGTIYQDFCLVEVTTALQNVLNACLPEMSLGASLLGAFGQERSEKAAGILREVGLADKLSEPVKRLSGGQKQRVAIAGIIAMQPRCILLDEPTAMLDPRGRQEVMRVLRQLNREKGITVVLITHYMEEAAACDRVIVMDDGHVLMDDVPRKVFSHVAELRQVGLDVPQTTELMTMLKEAGLPVQADIIDEQECIEALEALLTR